MRRNCKENYEISINVGGIIMDIAALSMSLSQMKVANQASISVLKLTMDTAQEQMEDMTKIMEQSVNPHIGSNLDLKL